MAQADAHAQTRRRGYLVLVLVLAQLLVPTLMGAQDPVVFRTQPENLNAQAASSPPIESSSLTFIQITDAHLFDGGKRSPTRAASSRADRDNWDALRWSLVETNDLVDAGLAIDFVVFTGDWGFDYIRFPIEPKLCNKGDEAEFQSVKRRGWPRLYTPNQAAKRLADQLSLLKVPLLYVLPGNNDLVMEDPCDLDRYQEMLRLTNEALGNRPPKLVDLSRPKPGDSTRFRHFQLIGMNTASFKNSDNYENTCKQADQAGCPNFELTRLEAIVRSPDDTIDLLFMHIPDLKDPLKLQQRSSPSECDQQGEFTLQHKCDAWNKFDQQQHDRWASVANSPKVGAIFCGHFHAADRSLYGNPASETSLWVDHSIATKTWIAPPLALKFQETADPTARGFLLVRIRQSINGKDTLVSVVPFWYQGLNHSSRLTILWLLLGALISISALYWSLKRRPSDAETLSLEWRTSAAITAVGLVVIGTIVWATMEFLVERLTMHPLFWVVPVFGAFGGLVGGLLPKQEFTLCSYADSKIRAGVLADIVIGIGGATTLAFLFGGTLNFRPDDPSSYVVLISISFIAGVIGKSVVQLAAERLLKQFEDHKD